MMFGRIFLLANALMLFSTAAHAEKSDPCASLGAAIFDTAHIDTAELIGAMTAAQAMGQLKQPIPAGILTSSRHSQLPAFCHVAGSARPTLRSDIKFDVMMPAGNWNGRLWMIGEGGYAGFIAYAEMLTALERGYAVVSTDTGHDTGPSEAVWAYNQPDKITDFGYRGVHESIAAAKAIVARFYGRKADYSYFSGCSNGGRQGLAAAQRYPQDFDGIISGAPARPVPNIALNLERIYRMSRDSAEPLTLAKLELLNRAAIAACDELDGLKDGIISSPDQCRFDPAIIGCPDKKEGECLTPAQIRTARIFYADYRSGGGFILRPGTEIEWAMLFGFLRKASIDWFRYLVHNDPNWDLAGFDLQKERAILERVSGPDILTDDADLASFRKHGGRLILYQGLADAAAPANQTIDYVKAVRQQMGDAQASEVLQLYLVPGMGHCGGGRAPDVFNMGSGAIRPLDSTSDMAAALEDWVERSVPPRPIVATQYNLSAPDAPSTAMPKVIRTRPLCPYPGKAKWNGRGSADDAINYSCEAQNPHAETAAQQKL